jgi:hypothetical protein
MYTGRFNILRDVAESAPQPSADCDVWVIGIRPYQMFSIADATVKVTTLRLKTTTGASDLICQSSIKPKAILYQVGSMS